MREMHATAHDQVELINSPWLWPLRTFLPVIRRTRIGMETGVVRPYDTGVYVRGGTYHRYASVERMVSDGWRAE